MIRKSRLFKWSCQLIQGPKRRGPSCITKCEVKKCIYHLMLWSPWELTEYHLDSSGWYVPTHVGQPIWQITFDIANKHANKYSPRSRWCKNAPIVAKPDEKHRWTKRPKWNIVKPCPLVKRGLNHANLSRHGYDRSANHRDQGVRNPKEEGLRGI